LAIRLSSPIRIDTSSMDTGSSARISFGRSASAWAKPTRCRCPPDSSCGNRCSTSAAGVSPTVSKTSIASARRSAALSSGRCSFIDRMIPCETRNTGLIELNGSWNTIGTSPW
jgi:hypothetical protein